MPVYNIFNQENPDSGNNEQKSTTDNERTIVGGPCAKIRQIGTPFCGSLPF